MVKCDVKYDPNDAGTLPWRYIAVENNGDSRTVCDAANPKTSTFPGVEHGLYGHNDICAIKEKHIASLPPNSLKLYGAGPMCNDFTKLRLLPDREDYIKGT